MRPIYLLCAAFLAPAAFAQTTVLTFDAGLSNSSSLPQDYGDRVTAATNGSYSYGGSGTFTPNVSVSHGGPTQGLRHWTSGYNDLTNVAYNEPDTQERFAFSFHADAGFLVAVNGFDLGNFGAVVVLPSVRVLGPGGTVLFEELNVSLDASGSTNERNYVFPSPPTAQVLTIEIDTTGLGGNSDNVCLDNISFSQSTGSVLGTSYCGPAVANSSGEFGTTIVLGSDLAADNDFTLVATGLPLYQFGFFLASQTTGFAMNPGGSQGNLCLGGVITRFTNAVMNTGGDGYLSLTVDLTNIPSPGNQILAGQTWNFSSWFRDVNPASTSNFSDGVSLQFN